MIGIANLLRPYCHSLRFFCVESVWGFGNKEQKRPIILSYVWATKSPSSNLDVVFLSLNLSYFVVEHRYFKVFFIPQRSVAQRSVENRKQEICGYQESEYEDPVMLGLSTVVDVGLLFSIRILGFGGVEIKVLGFMPEFYNRYEGMCEV